MYYTDFQRRDFISKAAAGLALSFLNPLSLNSSMISSDIITSSQAKEMIEFIPLNSIDIEGDLLKRAMKNFDRLEEEKYRPENIYLTEEQSGNWPADTEGRTILALTLLSIATKRDAKYIEEIFRLYPEKVNSLGYFGTIYKDMFNEQQLSGHGWMLRGLCAYYQYKPDETTLSYIKTMVENLVLPTIGQHKNYPINPDERKHTGGYMGTNQESIGKWILSSDIGCDYIFLDGVVHALQITKDKRLIAIIDEMIARFFEIDLIKIKAQTHATLTALRSILKYHESFPNKKFIAEVEKRFELYKKHAMTENFENYNWFERPQWTEPCAVIDSFILSAQLWRITQKEIYMEDAHKILYNGMMHEQRHNGGFGPNTCSGVENTYLQVSVNEAHWCCTMRGGEGLARAIQFMYFTQKDNLFATFYHSGKATLKLNNSNITISQDSSYPLKGSVVFKIVDSEIKQAIKLNFFIPSWTFLHEIHLNGTKVKFTKKQGFATIEFIPSQGDKIELSFVQEIESKILHNSNSMKGYHKFMYGPLVLGYEGEEVRIHANAKIIPVENEKFKVLEMPYTLRPIMHLMDPKVWKENDYKIQMIFKD